MATALLTRPMSDRGTLLLWHLFLGLKLALPLLGPSLVGVRYSGPTSRARTASQRRGVRQAGLTSDLTGGDPKVFDEGRAIPGRSARR